MSVEDLEMCRICLSSVGDMYCIFDANNSQEIAVSGIPVLNLLKIFSEIKISADDGLPNKICSKCLQRINDFYSLKYQCDMSKSKLKIFKELGGMPPSETVVAFNGHFSSESVTYVKKSTSLLGSPQQESDLKRELGKNQINEMARKSEKPEVNSTSSYSKKKRKMKKLKKATYQIIVKEGKTNLNVLANQIHRGHINTNNSQNGLPEYKGDNKNLVEADSRSEQPSQTSMMNLNENQENANKCSDNDSENPAETDEGVSFGSLNTLQELPNSTPCGLQDKPQITICKSTENLLRKTYKGPIHKSETSANKSKMVIDLLQKNPQMSTSSNEGSEIVELRDDNRYDAFYLPRSKQVEELQTSQQVLDGTGASNVLTTILPNATDTTITVPNEKDLNISQKEQETGIKLNINWIHNEISENPEQNASIAEAFASAEKTQLETGDADIIHFCSSCFITCKGLDGLRNHIIASHIQETFCNICNKNIDCDIREHCLQHMPSANDIEVAKRQFMSPTILHLCMICKKKFWTLKDLHLHKIVHRKNNRLVVPQLKSKSRRIDKLEFPCDICTKVFRSQLKLMEHSENSHNAAIPLDCPMCSKKFKSHTELTKHVKHCILKSRIK